MKIGFLAWNRFQIAQVAPILRNCSQAVLVFQSDRRGADTTIMSDPPGWCSVLSVSRMGTQDLDGIFDALLTQTSTPETNAYEKTKVIAVQYSMAKERHQYGPWHFMADARLSYGDYSNDILDFYSASYSVGNPRFDILFNDQMRPEVTEDIAATLDPIKKTVLYVPTYGKLSSFDAFCDAIAPLSEAYNLIISGHHNTLLREIDRAAIIQEMNPGNNIDITPYYYAAADVVVSDYSGAIFDALLARKPVVLFRPDHESKIGLEKLTKDSIEIARVDEIGPVVHAVDDLHSAITETLNNYAFKASNETLRAECFVNAGSAGEAAYIAIENIVAAPDTRSKTHHWTRRAIAKVQKIA